MIIENYKSGTILLVSHAAPIIAIIRGLVGDINFHAKIGVCSISELLFNPTTNNFKPVNIGNCSHLTSGADHAWEIPDYLQILVNKKLNKDYTLRDSSDLISTDNIK